MKNRKKFTIDRSTWRCGSTGKYALGTGHTELLNDEGFQCCLGQIMKQEGFTKDELKYRTSPDSFLGIFNNKKKSILLTGRYNNTLSNYAMHINDNLFISNKEREKRLKKLFNRYNYDIKFINKGIRRKSLISQ